MEIISINKAGLFYKVKFDNDETYKFHESVIIKYGLIRKRIVVSNDVLSNAIKDNEYYLALDKGVKYLISLKSKYETYLYLSKYYESNICNDVIKKLIDLKLIDDLEYSKMYVNIAKKKQYGPNKIFEELKAKKVLTDYIEIALEEYSDVEIETNCLKVMEKYLPSLKKVSKQLGVNKLKNYLVSKGFSNSNITNVIEKNKFLLDNISNEDELLELSYQKLLKAKKSMNEKDFKNKAIRSLCSKGFPLSKVLKIVERGK